METNNNDMSFVEILKKVVETQASMIGIQNAIILLRDVEIERVKQEKAVLEHRQKSLFWGRLDNWKQTAMNQTPTATEPKQKAMSRKEIAAIYGISTKTLSRRLKIADIDLPRGNIILPRYLKIIFEELG